MKPIRIFPKEFLAQQAICYSSSLPGAEVEKLDPGKLQPREGRESFQTNNCSSLLSYVGISKKYVKLSLSSIRSASKMLRVFLKWPKLCMGFNECKYGYKMSGSVFGSVLLP